MHRKAMAKQQQTNDANEYYWDGCYTQAPVSVFYRGIAKGRRYSSGSWREKLSRRMAQEAARHRQLAKQKSKRRKPKRKPPTFRLPR